MFVSTLSVVASFDDDDDDANADDDADGAPPSCASTDIRVDAVCYEKV
jgi:hypothetical protein